MKVEYSHNNSGGEWWLTDENWQALEKAGWKVNWVKDDPDLIGVQEGRWLGALASSATREGLHLEAAIEEWDGNWSVQYRCRMPLLWAAA